MDVRIKRKHKKSPLKSAFRFSTPAHRQKAWRKRQRSCGFNQSEGSNHQSRTLEEERLSTCRNTNEMELDKKLTCCNIVISSAAAGCCTENHTRGSLHCLSRSRADLSAATGLFECESRILTKLNGKKTELQLQQTS